MKVETVKVYDTIKLTDDEQKFLKELVEVAKNVVKFKSEHGYVRESVEGFLGDFAVMLADCGECNMEEYY